MLERTKEAFRQQDEVVRAFNSKLLISEVMKVGRAGQWEGRRGGGKGVVGGGEGRGRGDGLFYHNMNWRFF